MLTRHPRLTPLIAALAAALLGACAQDKSETVDTSLAPQDRTLINATMQETLERNQVGESANWVNAPTKRRGSVTPLRTFKSKSGEDCRDYQQILSVEGRSYVTFDTACRKPDKTWKSLNYASAADAWAAYAFRDYDYPYYRYGSHGYPYRYGYGYGPYYGYRRHYGYAPFYGTGFSIGFGRHIH